MSRKKAIDEWALNYWLLQRYVKFCYRIYYRKVEIVNKHGIPANEPVIIGPNHQNALMDALIFVCNTPFQNVFLARADIFKGKRLTSFLNYLNIMPVFRIRDGIENVRKNDEIFEKTTRVLHNSYNPLVLFAEGNHGDRCRLRPLVKGLFRIAFLAQEKYGNKPGVKIIPVGIDYGHYRNFRTTLFINIGEPIEVSDFYNSYIENPVAAINRLKDVFAGELRKLMIDIQTEEFYPMYMRLREIFNDNMRALMGITNRSLESRFKADKVMIGSLDGELETNPENIRHLNEKVLHYQSGLKQAKLRDWLFKKEPFGIPGLLVSGLTYATLFPLFLFGLINNWLPYRFTASRVKNIKDPQFHSSFKYVTGMIVFPVWYLVITGILAFLSLPVWMIIFYILFLPLSGLMAFEYYISLKKFLGRLRITTGKNSPEINALRNERSQIIAIVHEIVERQKSIL